jgi:hypothetical protein
MSDLKYYIEYSKIAGIQVITGDTKIEGDIEIVGNLSAIQKSFVIKHPSKEGWTLRYGALEGPENGVYIRGEIKTSKKEVNVELPYYWKDLIDFNTITANITSINSFQRVFVDNIDEKNITIKTLEETGINIHYMILAQRKDIPILEVEQTI